MDASPPGNRGSRNYDGDCNNDIYLVYMECNSGGLKGKAYGWQKEKTKKDNKWKINYRLL